MSKQGTNWKSWNDNISCVAPDFGNKYPIVLGKSFFQQNSGQRPTGFVSAAYRFKPASIDQSNTGHINFNGNSVNVQFDKRSNNNNAQNTNNNGANNMKSNYTGKSSMASNREFFLWFDANSQKMVLEKCGVQVKHLNITREAVQHSMTSYNDKSKERLKEMEQRQNKRKRQKSKSKKNGTKNGTKIMNKAKLSSITNNKNGTRNSTKIMTKNAMNTMNGTRNTTNNISPRNSQNSDTSSTRSMSQSVSPSQPLHPSHHQSRPSQPPQPPPQQSHPTQYRSTPNIPPQNTSTANNNASGPQSIFGNQTWDDSDDDEDEDLF